MKVELLTASACLEYASSERNKTHGYKIRYSSGFWGIHEPMEVWRMFYVLKEYWLSCNNFCAESSCPFEHAKNCFLKRRLGTNLCEVLIDVKHRETGN